MARKPNDLPTVSITIATTPQVEAYLRALVTTGLFGKGPAEAASRLLDWTILARLGGEAESDLLKAALVSGRSGKAFKPQMGRSKARKTR